MLDLIGKRLGQFEILEFLGEGGMAVVYKARQSSMDREVAVKVISSQLAGNADFVKRFENEARVIARLQHAHILPVYDFGRENGTIYLAMRLVDGGSLDQRLRQGPLPLNQTARLITQIASALTYAHDEGVVHRDLKPNNILLDKMGNPYLTDFGIAKLVEHSLALTATGAVMGTPSYMAPEQWRGEAVDARTDIYALGVMLYEMLTGALPFTGETPYVLMYKHFDETPPTTDKIVPNLPQGVNDVIHKAMAKDAAERFASADQLAEALNAVVKGLPTPLLNYVAHPAPMVAGENEATLAGPRLPNQQTGTVPLRAAASSTAKAASPPQHIVPRKIKIAVVAVIAVIVVLLVGAYVFMSRQGYHQLLKLEGHTQPIDTLAWSPDGKRIASAGEDKTLRLWNAASGELLMTLRGHQATISGLAWSPDGSKVATASDDHTIRIWNSERGETIDTLNLDNQTFSPQQVTWNPDGTKLASGQNDGSVIIWDVASKKPVVTYNSGASNWEPVSWNPNGKWIACAGADNTITILDSETGKVLITLPGHIESIYSLAWNSDGTRLASTSHDGTVRTWDLRTGKGLPLLTINASDSGTTSAEWSPTGGKLATSSGFTNLGGTDDYKVRIWDAETGKLLATLEGHDKPVMRAMWSPDGTRLATAGLDDVIRIWSVG